MANQYTKACFWCRIKMIPSGCWLWTSTVNECGYGVYCKKLVHRYMYQQVYGVNPGRLYVLHKCDTPACCRPDHLFLGNQDANMKDMVSKNRQNFPKGTKNGRAKLNDEKAIAIRQDRDDGMFLKELSRKYGTPISTIANVIYRNTWNHV